MLQVACVQMKWSAADYKDETTFQDKLDSLMRAAQARMEKGIPTLVAFPEDVGTPCVFIGSHEIIRGAKDLNEAIAAMIRANLRAAVWRRATRRVSWVRALFLLKAEVAATTYIRSFAAIARRHQVYIVAGTACLPPLELRHGRLRAKGRKVYNVSYLFGPDGKVIGWQRKVHLTEIEGPRGLDLTPGRLADLRVLRTELGAIGIAICYDAFHRDVLDRLAARGANLLVQPSANPRRWSVAQQQDWENGIWTALQQEPRFKLGVNPMMVGDLLGLPFEGQSCIAANYRLARDRTGGYADGSLLPGMLRVASSATEEGVIVERLHI